MARLVLRFDPDALGDTARDNFIAAKISKLRYCGAPDISGNKKGYSACLYQKSSFGSHFEKREQTAGFQLH